MKEDQTMLEEGMGADKHAIEATPPFVCYEKWSVCLFFASALELALNHFFALEPANTGLEDTTAVL